MDRSSNRIIVIGAGPVGLCLSLALAQDGIAVCLIEALGDGNFLEQVPRAGTNHPAIELRLSTSFTSFTQDADGVVAQVTNAAGEPESVSGAYLVSGEGARSI